MDIIAMQEKAQKLKKLKEEIESALKPQMVDTAQIKQLYAYIEDMCKNRGQSITIRRNKYLFIASVVMLYSPMSFVGHRIPKGVRTPLAKIMGYNSSEAISVAVRKVVSDYRIYSKFKIEVDDMVQSFANYISSTSR